MRYLCMGFHDERKWAALAEAERNALIEASLAYEDVLRAGGHVLDTAALQSADRAATLRFSHGEMTITDGPFAETKEQLGGIMVLEANDLNHAIQLMSQVPCMRVGGSMEIRPLNENLGSDIDRRAAAAMEA